MLFAGGPLLFGGGPLLFGGGPLLFAGGPLLFGGEASCSRPVFDGLGIVFSNGVRKNTAPCASGCRNHRNFQRSRASGCRNLIRKTRRRLLKGNNKVCIFSVVVGNRVRISRFSRTASCSRLVFVGFGIVFSNRVRKNTAPCASGCRNHRIFQRSRAWRSWRCIGRPWRCIWAPPAYCRADHLRFLAFNAVFIVLS